MENEPSKTREELLGFLNKQRDNLAFYLKEDHSNKAIPTACHDCGRLKQHVLNAEEDFEKFSVNANSNVHANVTELGIPETPKHV